MSSMSIANDSEHSQTTNLRARSFTSISFCNNEHDVPALSNMVTMVKSRQDVFIL